MKFNKDTIIALYEMRLVLLRLSVILNKMCYFLSTKYQGITWYHKHAGNTFQHPFIN